MRTHNDRRSPVVQPPAAPGACEPLEGRRLLATTPLVIDGTAGADTIRVRQSGTTLTVTRNGASKAHSTSAVSSITINGGDGADVLQGDGTVKVPLVLNGGNGDDRLRGGAAADTLRGGAGHDHLAGGRGRDVLDGGSGDDVLVSVGGAGAGDADTVTGGTGRDNFWADAAGVDRLVDRTGTDVGHLVGSFLSYRIARPDGTYRTTAVPAQLDGQELADPVPLGGVSGWKNFSGNRLFAAGGVTEHDVDQNVVGDCYFLAALASVARVAPTRISDRVVDLGDGTYAVHFQHYDQDRFVRVDGDLPVGADGRPRYAGLGRDNSIWGPIIEKAWAFYRRSQGTYASIQYGRAKESFKALGLSNISTADYVSDFGTATKMFDKIDQLLAGRHAVTFWTKMTAPPNAKLLASHVLTVTRIVRNARGVAVGMVLRDPNKTDGPRVADGVNDGYITVTPAEAAAVFKGLTWCKP